MHILRTTHLSSLNAIQGKAEIRLTVTSIIISVLHASAAVDIVTLKLIVHWFVFFSSTDEPWSNSPINVDVDVVSIKTECCYY